MTLPESKDFPIHTDKILSGNPKELEKYLRELIFSLQNTYGEVARTINGNIRADFSESNISWTPVLKDTANSGTTFTYNHQHGFVYRQGIMTDVFFDIEWTANTGAITGNMYIELPYKVAVTNEKPFVGVLQSSQFAYGGGTYCVVNGISNTYRAEIWNSGSGFTTANQPSRSAGQLIGHLRYIGKQNE